MHPAMLWWIAAAVLVGAELLTGTIYLLVIALGAAAGAGAAHMGLDTTTQMAVAAAVGTAGVILWHLIRGRKKPASSTTESTTEFAHNATHNKLDIGGVVLVQTWMHNGSTSVSYRGAIWTAVAANPAAQQQHPGRHVVVHIRHNQLVLQPEQTDQPTV